MLYQIVTGEIRAGDVSRWIDKTLAPVNAHWIGKDASEVDFIVLRPVKVPSEDETKDARLKLCRDDSICDASDCCSDCMYKTMLRLMGIQEVEG